MCHLILSLGKIVLNADFLPKGAIEAWAKGSSKDLGIQTSKADTHLYAWLHSNPNSE